ncbi:MAG: rRNA pseudouridine synthase [Phycisphaerae bacterium]|nr:rRNA pseudouridine synthase [Phycisphaerae bacterium]
MATSPRPSRRASGGAEARTGARASSRAPIKIPSRQTRRSGPTHNFQDDRRGPRIQKVLAESGVDSRRACEALVAEGRVTVNGQVIDGLPAWVNAESDDVRVDGRRVSAPVKHVYVMLFKPKSVLSTNSDPEGRKLAIDLVEHPSKARLFPVGRLDIDSSGLLLLTNDGELANRLTHPRFEMAKGYEVTVGGKVTDESVRFLAQAISGAKAARPPSPAKPAKTPKAANTLKPAQNALPSGEGLSVITRDAHKSILYLEVRENRNAELRRVLAGMGHPVKKLRRVRVGPLQLKGLQIGEWRDLTGRELAQLREAAFATPQQRAARKSSSRSSKG